MNKKHYMTPQMEAIEVEASNLLQASGGWGGDATKPAKVSLFDDSDDLNDFDVWEQITIMPIY